MTKTKGKTLYLVYSANHYTTPFDWRLEFVTHNLSKAKKHASDIEHSFFGALIQRVVEDNPVPVYPFEVYKTTM